MKRKIIFLVLFIAFFVNAFAQSPDWQWAKGFGGTGWDLCYSLAADSGGNIYATGYFTGTVDFDPGAGIFLLTSVLYYDIFILKLDSGGNFIWAKQIGGSGGEYSFSIAVDASANVYCTGSFNGTCDFDPNAGVYNMTATYQHDIFVTKLDSSGNLIWAKQFGGFGDGEGKSIGIDASGNIYTTGNFKGTKDFDPGTGTFNLGAAGINYDLFISKLDANGNFLWARQIGQGGDDFSNSLAVDDSGNVYTIGVFQTIADFDPGPGTFLLNSAGGYDIFISKLNSSGNFIWAKSMRGNGNDNGNSIALDREGGGVYATGYIGGITDFDPGAGVFNLTASGFKDIFVSKFDTSGNFVWAKTMGGSSNDDEAWSIAIDPTGSRDVYTTGYFSGISDFDPDSTISFNLTATGPNNIFLSKLDSSGNFVWAKKVDSTNSAYSNAMVLNPTGNVYLSGNFRSSVVTIGSTTITNAGNSNGSADIFISKLDTATITGLESITKAKGILLYPNPSKGYLTIQSLQFSVESIELYNLLGEKLINTKSNNHSKKEEVDVSYLATGMYILKVTTEKGTSTLKLIKE